MSTLGLILLVGFALVTLLSALIFCSIRSNSMDLSSVEEFGEACGTELRREIGSDKISLEAYYRPMRSMLDQMELDQAKRLERVQPAQWKQFRAKRIQAFRMYLRDLKVDFRRLEFKLRYMVLAGTAEDADLVVRLNRLKAQFGFRMVTLELRLLAFQFGVGSIEVSALLDGIQQLEKALEPRRSTAAASA
jgi:uncharacterized membrane protein YciS (DUF1049 family)